MLVPLNDTAPYYGFFSAKVANYLSFNSAQFVSQISILPLQYQFLSIYQIPSVRPATVVLQSSQFFKIPYEDFFWRESDVCGW